MQVRPLYIIITWWTFSETLYALHDTFTTPRMMMRASDFTGHRSIKSTLKLFAWKNAKRTIPMLFLMTFATQPGL